MGENITLTTEEYKRLLEAEVRAKVLLDYVDNEKYSLDKNRVRTIIGFPIKEDEDVYV